MDIRDRWEYITIMNREIKFRAWWKHPEYEPEGKMYFVGGLSHVVEHDYEEPERDFSSEVQSIQLVNKLPNVEKGGWNDAKYCTLMQYTGLKDKNGKEIYEGDIIKYDKDFQGKPFLDDDGYRFEIGFSCGSFLVIDPYDRSGERGGFSGFYLHTLGLSVIGNIYENPKLIEND